MEKAVIAAVALAACSPGMTLESDAGDAGRRDASADSIAHDAVGSDARDAVAPSDTAVDVGATPDVPVDTGSTLSTDRSHCTSQPDQPGVTMRTVVAHSGASMPYVAYVPAGYSATAGMPLVVALHGAGDQAMNYLDVLWRANADAQHFAVIAPEGSCAVGTGNTWCMDDPNSVLDAITDFEQCYTIDTSRRILNGFSAGGVITFLIGMQATNLFAGLSVMAANLGSAEALAGMRLIPAQWLIPVSQFQGTMDMNFPYSVVTADRDRMIAAGHTVYWHEFDGGHTTNAGFALTTYTDLMGSRSPTGGAP